LRQTFDKDHGELDNWKYTNLHLIEIDSSKNQKPFCTISNCSTRECSLGSFRNCWGKTVHAGNNDCIMLQITFRNGKNLIKDALLQTSIIDTSKNTNIILSSLIVGNQILKSDTVRVVCFDSKNIIFDLTKTPSLEKGGTLGFLYDYTDLTTSNGLKIGDILPFSIQELTYYLKLSKP
jgi:hypothetical protein